MKNLCGALLIGFVVLGLKAQNVVLPSDFRQQNLTEYNGSLLNPAYSLDRNNPSSVALWARWQWQSYDADPTSLFFNYTAKLNETSAAGAGFFQQNTGVFLNTGAALNYAYRFQLSESIFLGVGLNVFAFQQKLADERFFVPNPIQTSISDNFIVQLAPGINLNVDRFNFGLVSENILDYNFTTSERGSSADGRLFLALASYDLPISIVKNDPNSILRPSVYYKSIPGLDAQFGIITLLTTNKYWVQGGYNSFYGFSGGVGGRFFKRFSIGALVEVGTSPELEGKDPSFELVTSYKLGKIVSAEERLEEELIAEQEEQRKLMTEELTKAEKRALKNESKKQEDIAKREKVKSEEGLQNDAKNTEVAVKESKKEVRRKKDSIDNAKAEQAIAEALRIERQSTQAEEEALALQRQQRQDSILKSEMAIAEAERKKLELAQQNEVVQPKAGEKYEEVSKEGSLAPGYYLIANVFGTKKYFEAFVADMKKRGLNPNSFYRDLNKFNYVYLGKYNSISDARAARDSKLNGTYPEKLWIFRVTGK